MCFGRPFLADHAATSNGGWVARQPIFEQIVDHGVKSLLRRIPRLSQIEVNLHLSIQMARGLDSKLRIDLTKIGQATLAPLSMLGSCGRRPFLCGYYLRR